jgi:hypothetical protein
VELFGKDKALNPYEFGVMGILATVEKNLFSV